MPRVLVVCEYPTLSGGERSLLAALPGVREAGFDLCVAVPPMGPLHEALAQLDVRTVPLDLRDTAGQRLALDEIRRHLAEVIHDVAPDLLHANSLSMGRIAGPVVQDLGIPGVAHLRDIVRLSRRAIDDLNRLTRLIAVSQATRTFHVEQSLVDRKTVVVYNGVDLDLFRPRDRTGYLHRELRLPTEARLIGTIGQISLRKGFDVLLRAALEVAKHHCDVHFLLAGERYSQKQESRQYEEQLRRKAAEPPLAGCVHFLGVRSDVPRLLNELDLLVHPARQEPLGRVLLEAAAAGTPVVATSVGGTREIFPADTQAVLIPPDDPQRLAEEILALLADRDRLVQLSRDARARATSAFDIRHATKALVEQYRSALQGRGT